MDKQEYLSNIIKNVIENSDNYFFWVNGVERLKYFLDYKVREFSGRRYKISDYTRRISKKVIKGKNYYYVWNGEKQVYQKGGDSWFKEEMAKVEKQRAQIDQDEEAFSVYVNGLVSGPIDQDHLIIKSDLVPNLKKWGTHGESIIPFTLVFRITYNDLIKDKSGNDGTKKVNS